MFDVLKMGASGLIAQRTRMDTIANNVANINTTKDANGKNVPFRRRLVEFEANAADGSPGVHVRAIREDPSPYNKKSDPGNPDADADGYVLTPNVDLSTEMVNMIEARNAYDANITSMETAKAMFNSALRLIA